MKRIILEVLLVLGLGGAGAFGFFAHQKGSQSAAQLAEASEQAETAGQKLEEAAAELDKLQKQLAGELPPLQAKALQLEAVREALANGQTLTDLENAYKREKSLSPERNAGLGALRLLTRGGDHPSTVEAFKKTLDASDWGSRRNLICASQKALASAGQDVKVLSECLPPGMAKMPETDAKADKADKSDKTDKSEKTEKSDKADKDGHGDKHAAKDGKKHVHWDYEGEMGPENWGKEFPMCARGRSQSPLDIRGPFEKTKSTVLPDYKNGPLRIINNGHTIQVNVPEGSKLRIDSMPYDLVQFHFHRPSEEWVDGKPSAMVAHFVHKNKEGKLAVLGVLLKEGNENPGIKLLWEHAPKKEGPELTVEGVNFNPGNLLPRELEFWSYDGSLTTPPCTEGVKFFILKDQVNISREQVAQFPFKRNARPVQPLNGRQISAS